MNEDLKRAIRESLVYSLHSTLRNEPYGWTLSMVIISDFYNALNRRKILTSRETSEQIEKAIEALENMYKNP